MATKSKTSYSGSKMEIEPKVKEQHKEKKKKISCVTPEKLRQYYNKM